MNGPHSSDESRRPFKVNQVDNEDYLSTKTCCDWNLDPDVHLYIADKLGVSFFDNFLAHETTWKGEKD